MADPSFAPIFTATLQSRDANLPGVLIQARSLVGGGADDADEEE
jgi:hypothetical protein